MDTSNMDPELAKYLDRDYWQQKEQANAVATVSTTTPSAPAAISSEPITTQNQNVQLSFQVCHFAC